MRATKVAIASFDLHVELHAGTAEELEAFDAC